MNLLKDIAGRPVQEWTDELLHYWHGYYSGKAKLSKKRHRSLYMARAAACRVELCARRLAT